MLLAENQRVERDFVLVQDTFGAESRRIVESAERAEPRVRDDDIGGSLLVQQFPVALVGRLDRDEFRMVGFVRVLDHEHHLSGLAGEPLLGGFDDPVGFLLVVDLAVEHHDAR